MWLPVDGVGGSCGAFPRGAKMTGQPVGVRSRGFPALQGRRSAIVASVEMGLSLWQSGAHRHIPTAGANACP